MDNIQYSHVSNRVQNDRTDTSHRKDICDSTPQIEALLEKNSILRYGLKCKLIGSLVKSGFPQKTIHKHLIFHITNLQLWECIAKGVYLAVL